MEKIIHTDIFIAGAGAAGIAAATAAAELGLRVHIAERNSFPGGRATASAVGTVCGLYLRSDREPVFAMNGFPKEFGEQLMEISKKPPVKFGEGLWFLPSHPDDFETAAKIFLESEKIEVLYDTEIKRAEHSQNLISEIYSSQSGEEIRVVPKCVIDCSGEGVVCNAVDHAMISDEAYQAAAIVFEIQNVPAVDEFQLSFLLLKHISKKIEEGSVPVHYHLLSIVPRSLTGNSLLLKMGLPWEVTVVEKEAIAGKARSLVHEIFQFIISSVPGFEKAVLTWIAKEPGVRTGIRARGQQVLSDDDVLNCRKHADGICNGAWPVEYWKTGEKRVAMTYFAKDDFYQIPAGCLTSGEKENLFFAGKIISAEEQAIASARVIGICLGTGYAAGILAGYYLKNRSRAEAIQYIREKNLNG